MCTYICISLQLQFHIPLLTFCLATYVSYVFTYVKHRPSQSLRTQSPRAAWHAVERDNNDSIRLIEIELSVSQA